MIVSFVSTLFGSRSPSHIAGFVTLVVVYSFQTMIIAGSPTYVRDETGKRIPSLAHLNASSAVSTIILDFGVSAPFSHCPPDVVLRWSFVASKTMRLIKDRKSRPTKAATASSVITAQLIPGAASHLSAIATAAPERTAFRFGFAKVGQYDEATKPLAGQILETWIGRDRINFSHGRSPETGVVRAVHGVSSVVNCLYYKAVQ